MIEKKYTQSDKFLKYFHITYIFCWFAYNLLGTSKSIITQYFMEYYIFPYIFTATKFGDGVYFAVNAEYSCMKTYSAPDRNGVKRMYYCKVLTGDYALGEEGMRVPPANPKRGRHYIYNSVVNDLLTPDMFVIFHDSQAYPEYLIYFKL